MARWQYPSRVEPLIRPVTLDSWYRPASEPQRRLTTRIAVGAVLVEAPAAPPPVYDPGTDGFPYSRYADFARALLRRPHLSPFEVAEPIGPVEREVTLDKWFQPASLPLRNWIERQKPHTWRDPEWFWDTNWEGPPPPPPVPELGFWQPIAQPYVPRRNPVVAALGAHQLLPSYQEPRPLTIYPTRVLARTSFTPTAVERLSVAGTVEARINASD